MACITGGIAEAFYGPIPENVTLETRKRLPDEFLKIIDEFYEVFLE
jgi:ADP-ribosylglycohydrolase